MHLSEILLKAARKHIGLKNGGNGWTVFDDEEIFDKLMEREDIRRSEGIHTEAHKSMNEVVSRVTTEVKRGIWQCKVLEAKGTNEMWRMLKTSTAATPMSSLRMVEPV